MVCTIWNINYQHWMWVAGATYTCRSRCM